MLVFFLSSIGLGTPGKQSLGFIWCFIPSLLALPEISDSGNACWMVSKGIVPLGRLGYQGKLWGGLWGFVFVPEQHREVTVQIQHPWANYFLLLSHRLLGLMKIKRVEHWNELILQAKQTSVNFTVCMRWVLWTDCLHAPKIHVLKSKFLIWLYFESEPVRKWLRLSS